MKNSILNIPYLFGVHIGNKPISGWLIHRNRVSGPKVKAMCLAQTVSDMQEFIFFLHGSSLLVHC